MRTRRADGERRYGWRDGDRVVPAYVITQGRTRSNGHPLALETLVTATDFASRYLAALQMERQAIVTMSQRPISVAEISAQLGVPFGVARVLVGDLADAGYLSIAEPVPLDADGRPRADVTEKLLHGLRAL